MTFSHKIKPTSQVKQLYQPVATPLEFYTDQKRALLNEFTIFGSDYQKQCKNMHLWVILQFLVQNVKIVHKRALSRDFAFFGSEWQKNEKNMNVFMENRKKKSTNLV